MDGLKWRVTNMFVTKGRFDSNARNWLCLIERTELLHSVVMFSVRLIRILRNDIRVSCSHTTVRLQPCMPALPKPSSIDQLT